MIYILGVFKEKRSSRCCLSTDIYKVRGKEVEQMRLEWYAEARAFRTLRKFSSSYFPTAYRMKSKLLIKVFCNLKVCLFHFLKHFFASHAITEVQKHVTIQM